MRKRLGPPVGEATTVSRDVPCHRCDYNLRGLAIDGVCPECAAPVRVSLRDDLLRFADPDRLRRVGWGANTPNLLLLSFPILLLLKWIAEQFFTEDLFLYFLAGCVPLLFVGMWLLTTPLLPNDVRQPGMTPRRVTRAFLIVTLAGAALAVWLRSRGLSAWYWVAISLTPIGLAGMIGAWAFVFYVKEMSRLIRDDFSERKANEYLTGYFVSWLGFATGWVLGGTSAPFALMCVSIPSGIAAGAFAVLILFLPSYLVKKLELEYGIALELWDNPNDLSADEREETSSDQPQ